MNAEPSPRPEPSDEPQGPWVRKASPDRRLTPWIVAAVAVILAFAGGIIYASNQDNVSPEQRAAVDHWYLEAGGKQQWEAVAAAAASGGSGDNLTTVQLRVRCSNQIRAAESALAFQPIPDSIAHRHWTDFLLGTKDSGEMCVAAIDQDSNALMRQASDAGFAAGQEMDALTARLNDIHYGR